MRAAGTSRAAVRGTPRRTPAAVVRAIGIVVAVGVVALNVREVEEDLVVARRVGSYLVVARVEISGDAGSSIFDSPVRAPTSTDTVAGYAASPLPTSLTNHLPVVGRKTAQSVIPSPS